MNICVCIKQVPDTNEIKVDPVTHTLVRKGVPSIVNPFDTYAQEVGVRLKEKLGGKVVVISMGPEQAKEAIKTCLSVGADAGYLISSRKFGGSDTLATSYILSEAIKAVEEKEGLKFDLILCGKQAVDGDTAQVGPEIAEHLGLPQITYALDIIEKDGDIQVKRECDEGYDMISTQLPAVVTVVRLPYEPRYPTIKSKMAAKKKEIPVLTEEDIPAISLERCGLSGSPTKVKKTYTPVTEKNGVKLEGMEAEDAAKEVERECSYLPPFYYAEVGVANKLKKLSEEPAGDRLWVSLMRARQKTGNSELSVDVEKIQKAVNMEYDQVQAEAIRRAATAKVLVLTGGPGTGKTTTTQGIIAAYRTFGLRILLAAPTGRAAKRMTEATGLEARTIHRLLEFKPPEGSQKNEETPLEGDVLIVDECSMIDIVLMNALMKAIPPHMRLIFVGDIDQLPSVGAGNVLRDVIDSEVFPVVRLTRIFRQAQTSRIIMNAHKINAGEMPDTSNGKSTDFFFMTKEDPEDAARLIVELVNKKLPGYYRTPASQIQVLTPMQRGVVGATNLNMALQEALNPKGEGLRRSGFVYRPNDKVMQIKNNYDKEVFNGDIGIIESVDLQDRTLLVNFDGRSIEYDATELDELVHAYATTIHKAQGSEYPIVVMPVLMNHFVMLQRNLIYTGITRAKRILVMVGTKRALAYAVRNVTVTRRNTLLKERLAGQIQVKKPAKIYYPDFSGTAEDTRMVAENRSDYGN